MVSIEDYGQFETAWCPGCGNHSILEALKRGLVDSGLEPYQILLVSGIGQAAKTVHYLKANVFNGLHGRAVPVASGAKLANQDLKVIVTSGDGCNYGEGGNHFLAALRRNIDLTMIVHNNQVYGLTKGQASPTTQEGFVTKAQPEGVASLPFNPIAVAVAMQASFVARGFSGMIDHLAGLIKEALAHEGFALIDVLQPCVSFNKVNTFAWYKQRCYKLPDEYNPTDWQTAMQRAMEWGDRIPLGIIYRNQRPTFESRHAVLKQGAPVDGKTDLKKLEKIMDKFS